jgi:type 1 fimbria pilin
MGHRGRLIFYQTLFGLETGRKTMKSNAYRIAILLVGGLFYTCLHAEENMQFKGTLVEPPPCTVNQGNIIDVFFGEQMAIAKVDGTNYMQAIDYQLRCDASAAKSGIVMTLRGTAASFDEAAVQTDQPDLGIRLLINNQPFSLNAPYNIDPAHPPQLFAVPVGAPGATLTEGQFDATATLLAEYR